VAAAVGERRARWHAGLLHAGGPSELAGLLLRARGPAGGSEVMGWLVDGLGRLGHEAKQAWAARPSPHFIFSFLFFFLSLLFKFKLIWNLNSKLMYLIL